MRYGVSIPHVFGLLFHYPKAIRASNIASSSFASIIMPADPTTSGKEELFDVITGAPHCMASNEGKPNPSFKDGYKKATVFE
jgi:hypothetical protein